MTRPLLKQYGDLSPEDFTRSPVWVCVYPHDSDASWYDFEWINEETMRPYTGPLPVAPAMAYLVSARFTFADGEMHPGFVSPHPDAERIDFGFAQPTVFAPSGKQIGFWRGMRRIDQSELAGFYDAFNKVLQQTFPIDFQALDGLASGITSGRIEGFYSGKMQRLTR